MGQRREAGIQERKRPTHRHASTPPIVDYDPEAPGFSKHQISIDRSAAQPSQPSEPSQAPAASATSSHMEVDSVVSQPSGPSTVPAAGEGVAPNPTTSASAEAGTDPSRAKSPERTETPYVGDPRDQAPWLDQPSQASSSEGTRRTATADYGGTYQYIE